MSQSWLVGGEEFTDPGEFFGFVYRITNKLTGKIYIGKKLFTMAGRKQAKGKVKKIRKDSDWQNYWGSSKTLLKDIEEFGEDNFVREILYLCKTRGMVNYMEAKTQFVEGVLLKKDVYTDNFACYNDHIFVRVHRSHLQKETEPPRLTE